MVLSQNSGAAYHFPFGQAYGVESGVDNFQLSLGRSEAEKKN